MPEDIPEKCRTGPKASGDEYRAVTRQERSGFGGREVGVWLRSRAHRYRQCEVRTREQSPKRGGQDLLAVVRVKCPSNQGEESVDANVCAAGQPSWSAGAMARDAGGEGDTIWQAAVDASLWRTTRFVEAEWNESAHWVRYLRTRGPINRATLTGRRRHRETRRAPRESAGDKAREPPGRPGR